MMVSSFVNTKPNNKYPFTKKDIYKVVIKEDCAYIYWKKDKFKGGIYAMPYSQYKELLKWTK